MKPTLGRIVVVICDAEIAEKLNKTIVGGHHYKLGERVAAMVVGLNDNNAIGARLFPNGPGDLYLNSVPFSTGNQPGTWNWPDRISDTQEAAA